MKKGHRQRPEGTPRVTRFGAISGVKLRFEKLYGEV